VSIKNSRTIFYKLKAEKMLLMKRLYIYINIKNFNVLANHLLMMTFARAFSLQNKMTFAKNIFHSNLQIFHPHIIEYTLEIAKA